MPPEVGNPDLGGACRATHNSSVGNFSRIWLAFELFIARLRLPLYLKVCLRGLLSDCCQAKYTADHGTNNLHFFAEEKGKEKEIVHNRSCAILLVGGNNDQESFSNLSILTSMEWSDKAVWKCHTDADNQRAENTHTRIH